jgi:hypothetical protein
MRRTVAPPHTIRTTANSRTSRRLSSDQRMGVSVARDGAAGAGETDKVSAARDDVLAGRDAAQDLDPAAVLHAELDGAALEAFALGLDVDDGLAGLGEHRGGGYGERLARRAGDNVGVDEGAEREALFGVLDREHDRESA